MYMPRLTEKQYVGKTDDARRRRMGRPRSEVDGQRKGCLEAPRVNSIGQ